MEIQPPNINHEFLQELEKMDAFSRRSFDKWERILHSHGEALNETFALRHGTFDRFADVIVYPGSNEHCEVSFSLSGVIRYLPLLFLGSCEASSQA